MIKYAPFFPSITPLYNEIKTNHTIRQLSGCDAPKGGFNVESNKRIRAECESGQNMRHKTSHNAQ